MNTLFVYFSSDKNLYSDLKNILGFYPSNIELYKQAFRHSSVAKEVKDGVKDSNERLEFLGDAVLSVVIADYLFKLFPYKDEGFLTKLRSKIVSRSTLNNLAVKLGLDKMLESTLDNNPKNFSANGDAFEAFIGAVYLDKGYTAAQNFILNRIVRLHIDMDETEKKETDFKSKIVEWAQKERKVLKFNLIEETGERENKQYHVEVLIDNEPKASALHYSKKRAEQISAEKACIVLGI